MPSVTKVPPGTSKVMGVNNLYMDVHEVTNQQWLAYLHDLSLQYGDSSETYLLALPDTNIWKNSYHSLFFKPGKFLYYPVVGISFPQVIKFCEWRSEESSQMRNKPIRYSLPSLRVYKISSDEDSTRAAAGLYSLKFDHRRKFIGLCDNAAEMLDVEGLAIKGFSEDGNCMDEIVYQNAHHTLGFRCIASYEL